MSPRTRNILIVIVTLIVAFGIGAAWQFTQADRARSELAETEAALDAAQYELALERLHSTLALATVSAQLGNYERSRQLASDFFTGLATSTEQAPAASRTAFDEMLRSRDEMITSLSRAQPDAGLGLARMLARYREALGREADGLMPGGEARPLPADTMG